MKKKNTIDTKEIRKQAEKLFGLIEDAIEATPEDVVSESIADQMGDLLRSSAGFKELDFAYELAKPKSEKTTMDLDEATMYMEDEVLSDLFCFAHNALSAAYSIDSDEPNIRHLVHRIRDMKRPARKLLDSIQWEYWGRVHDYGLEIKELKLKNFGGISS